jgi:SAM-dependent methyltransferase/uncharacterized protein YbaR (Trm112 family)
MIIEVLDLIHCPSCKSNLTIDGNFTNGKYIEKGECFCKSCSAIYPIVNDIIFFSKTPNSKASETQKKVYSYWWNESHSDVEYDDSSNVTIFKQTIKLDELDFKNGITLDLGCGNGRFSSNIAQIHPKLLVLFDISDGVEKAYKDALKITKNVIAIQGDIMNIPFKPGVFDNVYSWGVLHHTGSTREAFNQASILVKPNGKLGVYLYENHPVYSSDNIGLRFISIIRELIVIRPLRFLSQFFSPNILIKFFYPIFLFERFFNIGLIGCHGSGENKFEKNRYFRVVIDRFKSRYASEHSNEEVVKWFIDKGFNDIEIGEGVKVCITGRKEETKSSKVSVMINL